jgi:hypothetical protein
VTADAEIGSEEGTSPAIAFGAGHFAAVWAEASGVHIALLDKSGEVSGTRAVAGSGASEPSVTALPTGGYLVVWREPGAVRAERVAADGTAAGSPFTVAATAGGDSKPAAASVGGKTIVAWADASGVTAAQLEGTTIASRSTIAGTSDPDLTVSGDSLALVFSTGAKLGHVRFASPARGFDPAFFRDAPGKANVPRVSASADGSLYVTWEDDRGGDGNETVYVTRIAPDGKRTTEVPVPGDVGSANYPDVATVNGRAAVVYYQFRDGPPAVYLTLLGPDLHRVGDELRVSGRKPARYARVAAADGALGVAYVLRNGPAHVAVVVCR